MLFHPKPSTLFKQIENSSVASAPLWPRFKKTEYIFYLTVGFEPTTALLFCCSTTTGQCLEIFVGGGIRTHDLLPRRLLCCSTTVPVHIPVKPYFSILLSFLNLGFCFLVKNYHFSNCFENFAKTSVLFHLFDNE